MTDNEIAPTPSNMYSFSRVKTFHQCPLRYRFRYIEGRKEAFRSIESFLGNVVHDVLEWLYNERDGGRDPVEEAVLEEFARRWVEERDHSVTAIRIADEDETYLRLGREMLARFFRETFVRDQSQTVALEQRLSVRLSETVLFTGFADRVGRTDKGRLFVIDYKTSKSEGNGSEFSEGLQAPLYAACVLRHHEENEALAGYPPRDHPLAAGGPGARRSAVAEVPRSRAGSGSCGRLPRGTRPSVRVVRVQCDLPVRPGP